MIVAALLANVGGIALVRLGWGGRGRAAMVGWALVAIALAVLAAQDGAWGLAVGGVAGIAAALSIVAYAGAISPARTRRPAREAPSIVIPRSAIDIARRFAVFVLVVPGAFAATQWVAFAAYGLARDCGARGADGLALMLFTQPVLWAALATILLTRATTRRMIAPLVVTASLGTVLWGLS